MSFIVRQAESDPIVTLDDNGDGGVFVYVGDTCIVEIREDGTVKLCDYVDKDEVGDLKITDGKDDGWGDFVGRRARVFFNGEELVLPSEEKPVKAKRSRKAKTQSAAV